MRVIIVSLLLLAATCLVVERTSAFSVPSDGSKVVPSRRAFFADVGAATAAAVVGTAGFAQGAAAAPQIFTTKNGIKYAVLQEGKGKSSPLKGDIVAIEYTGYLTDGTIFDATHSAGKSLVFELGGNAVIDGLNEMVENMNVGQKVQAIIPPQLAFGDKGLCIESGECLIKPKSTLVYDVYLKRDAIPPP